jgi:hypothetical protein
MARRILVVLAMTAVGLLVAGCERATGGGYIPSAIPGGGKATFAFSAKCTPTTNEDGSASAVTKGQLQYNDRAADVKFHANIDGTLTEFPAPPDICEESDGDESVDTFFGEYRVHGGPKEGEGTVELEVRDNGEPGINGDEVTIALEDGRHGGYTNSGTVQGGNVQVH